MIEVERKYRPTQGLLDFLHSLSVEQRTNVDQYWDYADNRLMCQDYWLRKRNGNWEIKKKIGNNYREIEGEDALIGLNPNELLPVVTLTTQRKKYKVDGVTIDYDAASAQNFTYQILELEIVVQSPDQVDQAEQKIKQFEQRFGLQSIKNAGKLVTCIRQTMPDLYVKLKENGVV